MRTIRTSLLLAAATALAGCSSDGSSDFFVDFFERQPVNSSPTYDGIGVASTYQTDGTGQLTSNNDEEFEGPFDVTAELDEAGNLTDVTVDGIDVDTAFGEDLGDDVRLTGGYYAFTFDSAGEGQGVLRIANPAAQSLRYHTFGAWAELGPDGGIRDGEIGAVVFGEPTAFGDLPTTSNATYDGESTGFYTNETGDTVFATRSDMDATVNFQSGAIQFSTSNTVGAVVQSGGSFNENGAVGSFTTNLGTLDAQGGLNLIGNAFGGNIVTEGGLLGSAEGLIAGPDGSEIGGVLYADDADETYTAGFGGRR